MSFLLERYKVILFPNFRKTFVKIFLKENRYFYKNGVKQQKL